ncbi:halocyanin domain-containing protein [Halorientalis pallida]|uniref:halocyanin domain-containing protein n=1 Tax=Halorientalis pallida TaxID=2479928 RepID=UPI003C703E57
MTWQSKRRAFLRTAVVATAAGVAGCSDNGSGDDPGGDDEDDETDAGTQTATPEETEENVETPEEPDEPEGPTEPDEPADVQNPEQAIDDWLRNTKNYNGNINDQIGETDVSIGVGVDDTSGSTFAFGKPAVRVTTGTRIQWIWEDPNNAHNVRERNGLFDSGDPVTSSGKTFTVTLTEPGVYLYKCSNHGGPLGMRGAIIVEDEQTLSGYPEVDEWLSDYGEYDGRLTDRTGESSVSVEVGAGYDGQNRSFSPVAILVDQGTEIVFEWTGRGGSHDVTWKNDSFEPSDNVRDASYTYSVTMDEPGVYLYYCRGDRPYNGRGAVVVR